MSSSNFVLVDLPSSKKSSKNTNPKKSSKATSSANSVYSSARSSISNSTSDNMANKLGYNMPENLNEVIIEKIDTIDNFFYIEKHWKNKTEKNRYYEQLLYLYDFNKIYSLNPDNYEEILQFIEDLYKSEVETKNNYIKLLLEINKELNALYPDENEADYIRKFNKFVKQYHNNNNNNKKHKIFNKKVWSSTSIKDIYSYLKDVKKYVETQEPNWLVSKFVKTQEKKRQQLDEKITNLLMGLNDNQTHSLIVDNIFYKMEEMRSLGKDLGFPIPKKKLRSVIGKLINKFKGKTKKNRTNISEFSKQNHHPKLELLFPNQKITPYKPKPKPKTKKSK